MNFLPLKDQIEIKKQYRKRFFLILGFLFFSIAVINFLLIAPFYLFLSKENKDLKKQALADLNGGTFIKQKDMEASLKNISAGTDFLKKLDKNPINLSHFIYEIVDKMNDKTNGVSIESMNFENSGSAGGSINKIVLRGKAKTRNDFLVFLTNLKNTEDFKEIISPPQNILKNENIDYQINLLLKK